MVHLSIFAEFNKNTTNLEDENYLVKQYFQEIIGKTENKIGWETDSGVRRPESKNKMAILNYFFILPSPLTLQKGPRMSTNKPNVHCLI